jgi:tRNA modification GTPase
LTIGLVMKNRLLPYDQYPIIAQCTPHGPGALALLRITGMESVEVADTIARLASKKLLADVHTHTIHYGTIVADDKSVIDHVLFLLMRSPHTFTGQDTIEITCHNNPFIIEAIIQAAISAGARMADPGEFSKRAVLNEKIDMVQAEAINELIHANTQQGLKKAMAQLEGTLSDVVQHIEELLLKALVFCESSFEFIEEEGLEFGAQIGQLLQEVEQIITSLQKTEPHQHHIKNGVRIAFIGSVNAGKSSLFNALLGKNRAIVSDIAGTTRDVIEAGLYRNGVYWTLIDTAGIRSTTDIIEQEGITRSFEQAAQADIIILVYDGLRQLLAAEQQVYEELRVQYNTKIITVASKADIADIVFDHGSFAHAVSICRPESINLLEHAIFCKVQKLFENTDTPFLLNKRHYQLLANLERILAVVRDFLNKKPIAYELIAYHLNDAMAHLAQMSGKSMSEKTMDAVFKEFCVGK